MLRVLADKVYPHLGSSAQNLVISAYGLLYRHRRLGGEFRRYVEEYREREWWSEAHMHSHLEERLRHMLAYAWENVPYYRERWGVAGVDARDLAAFRLSDLPRLPIVPKSDLRRNAGRFLVGSALGRERPLEESTSGSTGEPVTVTTTARLQRAYLAVREARSFGWAGTSMLLPRATIGGRKVVPRADSPGPYYRFNHVERQCYFSAFHISPDHLEDYLEGFRRYRPRVLTGYSSAYYSLARMMLVRKLTLDYKPDALILSADQCTTQMRAVMAEAFGARAYEEYGSVENVVLATECEQGRLHVSCDFGIVEVVDDQGQPLAPGCEGRLVCTTLINEVQPLIRYDIGDLGVWSGERCPCGRHHLPVLREIVGRIEDAVVGPDGREIVRICSLQNLPHVLAAQLVQERLDLVKVRVVASEEFNARDEARIREIVAVERLGNVRVEIERVDELERTSRGKVRRVIRRLDPESEQAAGAAWRGHA